MTQIDTRKPVLVTGATGYVAGWLVKQLLEQGLTVHAAVRDPDNKAKIDHLDALAADSPGTIRYFASDLLKPGSYAEAMAGCELVYHTASPFSTHVSNPQKQLIEPAVQGTRNVLEQANATPTVKRVVLTSSCAAIYTDCTDLAQTPDGKFTEDVWNSTASLDYHPYSYSKTLAEQAAWEIATAQSRWDLVVINPSLVMGPALNPQSTASESLNILKQLGDGTMKMGVPNLGIGLVDVRDVAQAHYSAGFSPEAAGRYITSGHNSSVLEMAQALQPRFGQDFPISDKPLPKWLLMLVGPFINKTMTRRYIQNNVNKAWIADNSKSRNELGLTYRPLQATMEDAFQNLIDARLI